MTKIAGRFSYLWIEFACRINRTCRAYLRSSPSHPFLVEALPRQFCITRIPPYSNYQVLFQKPASTALTNTSILAYGSQLIITIMADDGQRRNKSEGRTLDLINGRDGHDGRSRPSYLELPLRPIMQGNPHQSPESLLLHEIWTVHGSSAYTTTDGHIEPSCKTAIGINTQCDSYNVWNSIKPSKFCSNFEQGT